MGSLGGNLM